jgi:hypothetical protein
MRLCLAARRRRKLMKAMDRGDWSAVVEQQTQEALGGPAGGGAAAAVGSNSSSSGGGSGAAAGPGSAAAVAGIVSPFADVGAAPATGKAAGGGSGGGRPFVALSVAAVQAALEEVGMGWEKSCERQEETRAVDAAQYSPVQAASRYSIAALCMTCSPRAQAAAGSSCSLLGGGVTGRWCP